MTTITNYFTTARERVDSIRRHENGFSLITIIVGIAMLGMLTIMVIQPILTASKIQQATANEALGLNQGSVADASKSIHEAGVQFKEENPDDVLTKDALIAEGFTLPAHMVWNVAEGGHHSEICSIVYSTTEQTDEFTASNPAEYNRDYEYDAARSFPCWTYSEIEGNQVPNWGTV